MVYFLFPLGLMLLVAGADVLVKGASSLARRLGVSVLVVGLTVVAFGTSTPELFVNVTASLKGSSAIAVGNVVGSNIANIFLILGVAALIYPLEVGRGTVWKEIPLSLLAALLLLVTANDALLDAASFSAVTRIDGLVYLLFFAVFLYYSFSIAQPIEGLGQAVPTAEMGLGRSLAWILGGLGGLALGGHWIVSSAIAMAARLGVEERIIGLTLVAVGTSLPELATSAVAAYRRRVEIAVGNVVGSNIFNIFLVLGINAVIRPLPFQTANNLDLAVLVLASLLLFAFMFTGRRHALDRWEGLVFVGLYGAYMFFLLAAA